ncbi:MAG TPA: restriction endonuclease [Streptosporangiaceae bacterium]
MSPSEFEREQARLRREQRERERQRRLANEQAQETEAARRNQQVTEWLAALDGVFAAVVRRGNPLDFEAMKPPLPRFAPGQLAEPEPRPVPDAFRAAPLRWYERLLPGQQERLQARWERARAAYAEAEADWRGRETAREGRLATLKEQYEREAAKVREQHIRIDELKADFHTGKRAAVEDSISWVLAASQHPSGFPAAKAAAIYLAKPRQLLLEYQFPLIDQVIPTQGTWRYNKTRDRLEVTTRSATDRRERYKSLLAQLAVRTLYEIFTADAPANIDSVVFNGIVEDENPATGRQTRPTLISVRAFREEFLAREFGAAKFSPAACLKDLRAHVSRAPAELEPVEPVLRFEPDRARVLEEEEILSTLSDHQNIMDLPWPAFETLIRDLFNKMGFDTYQTKPSRDGGVDCFAFLQQAVVGMKVVISAKQYSNKVPVEAVRDLAGTIDLERAGKGILVTTSSFTRASYKIQEENPRIELIDGQGLLALIKRYTGQQMKIEFTRTQAKRTTNPD